MHKLEQQIKFLIPLPLLDLKLLKEQLIQLLKPHHDLQKKEMPEISGVSIGTSPRQLQESDFDDPFLTKAEELLSRIKVGKDDFINMNEEEKMCEICGGNQAFCKLIG